MSTLAVDHGAIYAFEQMNQFHINVQHCLIIVRFETLQHNIWQNLKSNDFLSTKISSCQLYFLLIFCASTQAASWDLPRFVFTPVVLSFVVWSQHTSGPSLC